MRLLGISKSFYQKTLSFRNMSLISVFVFVGLFSAAANAQCELQTIWSPNPGQDYVFGTSVTSSASMDVIVIGEDGYLNLTGAAYVYRRIGDTWELDTMLLAPDGPATFSKFGNEVSMSADGKTILIGEVFDSHEGMNVTGAAWIFIEDRGKWIAQQKLLPKDVEENWVFGQRLALSADGNVAAISATGAPLDPVYVFTREGETWTEADKLEGNGYALGLPWIDVSADGSVIAIGAPNDSEMGSCTGAAYMFVRDGAKSSWLFRQKIHTLELEIEANFGRSVSLSATGNTLIASALDADGKDTINSGAVYVFERKGDLWFEQAKLIASDAQTQDFFGAHTKLTPDGQRAIINSGNNAPYVFDFIDNQWVNTMRLTASDTEVGIIGDAIAITDDGSTALLGAPSSRVNGVVWYGAAALFDLAAPLGDLDCDGVISTVDLLEFFSNWGACYDCEFLGGCPGDFDLDCTVGISDLEILLNNWG